MPPKSSVSVAAAVEPRTVHFEPLDETNYHYRVMPMEAELVHRDLWSGITFDEEVDGKTDAEVAAAKDSWKAKRSSKKMAEARAEIVARVADSQLDHFLSLRDPMQIWEVFAGVHIAHGLATWLVLRRKFLRLVKDEKETVAAGVGWVKKMAFQLVVIGIEVSDEDWILALMNGLDDSYELFVISLDLTPALDLMLAHIVNQLLNDEMRHGKKGVKKEGDEGEGEEMKGGGGQYSWQVQGGSAGSVESLTLSISTPISESFNISMA
jgi:hypothetical protein